MALGVASAAVAMARIAAIAPKKTALFMTLSAWTV
jgi:hypothetical protein